MWQKFKALSRAKKIGLGIATLVVLGMAGGGNQTPQASTGQKPSDHAVLGAQTTNAKPKAKAPVITYKTETETQSIPFESTTVNSNSLAKGTSKITTPGVNGVSTLTYKLTFTDGKQTAKDLVGQETTTPPVTQVTTAGTYVAPKPVAAAPVQPSCPNGTYVNSAGNTVCSPYASSSAPAGATAECRDGSYSFSQSHSGTCSHHGGVARWL
jgi:hypothetical protein